MKIPRINSILPTLVLFLASSFVALSFLIYYLVDLRNVLGIRDILLNTSGVYFYFHYVPFFFQHYGRDGGFAEVIQWFLLAVTIVLAIFFAGRYFDHKRTLSKFWLLMGIGFMLMLLEDAGEVRHLFMSYVQWAADEPDQGIVGTAVEGIFFIILGGLPIYALWRYGQVVKECGRVYLYMLLGIVAHAVAASLSFVGTAFQMTLDKDIYSLMGEKFKQLSLFVGTEDLAVIWDTWDAENWLYQVDFYLMDSFFEENIELLGNAFFLAAALAFYIWHTQRNTKVT